MLLQKVAANLAAIERQFCTDHRVAGIFLSHFEKLLTVARKWLRQRCRETEDPGMLRLGFARPRLALARDSELM